MRYPGGMSTGRIPNARYPGNVGRGEFRMQDIQMECRQRRIPDTRYLSEMSAGRIPDVRYLGGMSAGRIPDVRYLGGMSAGRIPDVGYPSGMSAEKNSGCETSEWNVGGEEFRMQDIQVE